MKLSSFHLRVRVIAFLVILIALIILVRLFSVQIINGNSYKEKADRQYATPSGDVFERGTIFFSKKDLSLVAAGSVSSGFKVAINPSKILNQDEAYNAINKIIPIDYNSFIEKVSKKNDPYEEIAVRLNKEQADLINGLKISGVYIYKDNWRFYPGGSLGAHTLGFLAYKGDDRVGQYGLERFYNDTLSKSKNDSYVNFFAEVFSDLSDLNSKKSQGDIVTTIEPTVQANLETEMKNVLEKWNADQVGGVIINPQNGEIYAMSIAPTFDLNNFKEVKNPKMYSNPIVENVFEFGSVIKPLVIASALDVGVINPETKYYDSGFIVVNKKTINNFDKKGRGTVTIQDVLDQSLNTGMVFVENKIGHEKFRNYMKSFGIGEKTNIDLPNETRGLIGNLDSPRDIEYANAAFGQGIALTPIEAVRAFSVLANGGKLITPHLVKQIRYDNGLSKTIDPVFTKENLIKKETSETITRMLVHVFENYDMGKHKFTNYSVASKTGTGQVAMENGKGYYADRHMHSFFGYFPAYEPKFLVFIFANNPKGVKYASQTLIPPFVNMTKFLLNYYNVPPDR